MNCQSFKKITDAGPTHYIPVFKLCPHDLEYRNEIVCVYGGGGGPAFSTALSLAIMHQCIKFGCTCFSSADDYDTKTLSKIQTLLMTLTFGTTTSLTPTFVAGQGEGTFLELIRVSVDSSTSLQQLLCNFHMPCAGSLHQRGVTILIVHFH